MTSGTSHRVGTRSSKRLTAADLRSLCAADILDADKFDYIDGVSTPDCPLPNRVVFADRYTDAIAAALAACTIRNLLVIAVDAYKDAIPQPRILTPSPRAVFALIVEHLFDEDMLCQSTQIHERAFVHPSARLSIGVVVGADSVIGAGTRVAPNVVIGPRVRIGADCVIKSGTVIGQPGFGIYRDAQGVPHRLPHVAGAIVGNNVEIGALNTVAGGTIHPTLIEDHVKTDDHVHIAHNCIVGSRTLVTACAEISGSVSIGPDCWIGPNAAIRDGVTVGQGAFIGIAANVVCDVPARDTVMGNPARPRP